MGAGEDAKHGAGSTPPEPYERPDLYDLLFADYREDLGFWLGLARAARGPVLDLACGTGRVLVPLLEAGVDADGADLYPGMLERARANAASRSLEPRLYAADMRDFSLPRRYGLIVIPFNAFAHALTTGDQIATLERCHAHLDPGGRLVFDVFSATPAMLTHPVAEPVMEMEVTHPADGHRVQLYDGRSLDPLTQTQLSRIEIRELDLGGGLAASHRFETRVRWVYPSEMELLLRVAGFSRWEICGGHKGELVTADTALLVVSAWKG